MQSREVADLAGRCRMALTPPEAHPMSNADIVIGYTTRGAFRVVDSFTPSRATPLPDAYWQGLLLYI